MYGRKRLLVNQTLAAASELDRAKVVVVATKAAVAAQCSYYLNFSLF